MRLGEARMAGAPGGGDTGFPQRLDAVLTEKIIFKIAKWIHELANLTGPVENEYKILTQTEARPLFQVWRLFAQAKRQTEYR